MSEILLTNKSPGVDVFFDNVGGKTFDVVLGNMSKFGRVAMCGQISLYNSNGMEIVEMKHVGKILSQGLQKKNPRKKSWQKNLTFCFS